MVKIIAHRGASENAPENTLSSISEAWAQSADGVEVDIRMTKDSELVCIHDNNTLRTAGNDAIVEETNFRKLREMDVGAWRGKEWMNELIPLLSEVMDLIHEDKKLFIEVKNGIQAVQPLGEILENYSELHKNISVVSFNEEVITQIKQKFPDIKVNLLIAFDRDPDIKSSDLLKKLKQRNIDGTGLQSHMQLTKAFIDPIMEANKEVHVWTVDQPEQAKHYKEMGLHSITTNIPGSIKTYLLSA